MDRRIAIDERMRIRLRSAGDRLHAAENERRAAITDLKMAVLEANGSCTAADAADLTGVFSQLLAVIQPELRSDSEPRESW